MLRVDVVHRGDFAREARVPMLDREPRTLLSSVNDHYGIRGSAVKLKVQDTTLIDLRHLNPADPDATMKLEEAMRKLEYTDRKSFISMAKRQGLKLVYINSRVIRIRRVVFSTWLDSRAA